MGREMLFSCCNSPFMPIPLEGVSFVLRRGHHKPEVNTSKATTAEVSKQPTASNSLPSKVTSTRGWTCYCSIQKYASKSRFLKQGQLQQLE